MSILKIGCGTGRDAIPLTHILNLASGGHYVGIDIIKSSIGWCVGNIQKKHLNFIFHHMDIGDEIHNPGGAIDTLQSNLPAPDGRFDRIILQSVFTHLMQYELEHYLSEFRRVLKPDGLVYVTVFIYDDAIIESAQRIILPRMDCVSSIRSVVTAGSMMPNIQLGRWLIQRQYCRNL